jgi:2-polyprenyl-6-hydroxyphenyl methylase/3-demethylubiquinone-9 3-methyltransferase
MNVDQAELSKFNDLASRWWDPTGEFRPLHEINPLRLDWIDHRSSLAGKRVIDIGCGGGILAESMAARGARVLGIDMADKPLKVAQLHQLETGVPVDYKRITAEAMAEAEPAGFDVVTCMEMLEHVPDPASTVAACAALVKPGGHIFFSTLNRNLKSYLLAIVGAEYLLRMLPRGTHDYEKFIKPSELSSFVRAAGLTPREIAGMHYNPLNRQFSLSRDADVNYLMACTRE